MTNKEIFLDDNSSKSVELSKIFRQDYLDIVKNPELIKEPILTTNLLFQIILDLKNNMFHTDDSYLYQPSDKDNNQMKIALWENEFINTEKNEIKKRYKTSFFLKNRNKTLMTKSLDFLKKYKNEIYTFENSKGKKITTSGGLIKDWYFSDKTGVFEITISLYWANKIVTLEKGMWNSLRHDIMTDFKDTRQRFFILWLMNVKKYSGTKKNYKDLIDAFQLNYSSSYELMRGFIQPIKAKLDNEYLNDNWFSFNSFIDEDNKNNIQFIPYDVKPKADKHIDPETQKLIESSKVKIQKKAITYRLKYLKRRHTLSLESVTTLKELILKEELTVFELKYEQFKKEIKKEKKKATDYQGIEFVKKIKEIYK